ncbi:unnamed protein product [Euphydryas editha]|uniref:FP protein C-terminal domain-containing protein n=1 Tax=Euphydryas editha TaxID=104508 RepID=A0AAU9UMX6_EUPED|nr:unnamed protein product [Euphydryas editha]
MLRSPNKSRSPSKLYGSNPDLSNTSDGTSRIKRKYDHEITEMFEAFSNKIWTSLNNWKTDIERSISGSNDSLTNTIKSDFTKLNESFLDIKGELANFRKDHIEMKKSLKSLADSHDEIVKEVSILQKSLQFHSDKHDELNEKVNQLEQKNKAINTLETRIESLVKDNKMTLLELNAMNQRDRLLNLELVGIPEIKSENLKELVVTIAKNSGVNISQDEILEANRITPKTKLHGRPKNIVVKLKSRLLKDNIISGARKNRLTTKAINISGDSKPIYINEHLSPVNKQILKKCREAAKAKQYRYVWTKNGRIFVRKNDTSPAIQITEESDIVRIH